VSQWIGIIGAETMGLGIVQHLAKTYGPRFDPPQILVGKVVAGELGRKTGKGFYDWSEA